MRARAKNADTFMAPLVFVILFSMTAQGTAQPTMLASPAPTPSPSASPFPRPSTSPLPHQTESPAVKLATATAVENLRLLHVFSGLPATKPGEPITLQTYVTMIYRTLKPAVSASAAPVSAAVVQPKDALSNANRDGLVLILPAAARSPSSNMSRENAAALAIVRAFQVGVLQPGPLPIMLPTPADIDQVSPQKRDAVRLAIYLGIFSLDRDHKFHPKDAVDKQKASIGLNNLVTSVTPKNPQ